MATPTQRRRPDGTAAAARFGARSLLGLSVLVALALPFLALVLAVQRRWSPLETFDAGTASVLNEAAIGSPVLLEAARWVTHLGDTATAVYLVLLTMAFLWIRRQRRLVVYVGVTGAGLMVLVPLTKALIGRARPVVAMPVTEAPGNASFPSGHAMTAVVVYGMLLLVLLPSVRRGLRPWLVTGAVMVMAAVGLTRLLLGVHFVSDVLAGWSLGAAWLAVTTGLFRVWRREEDTGVLDESETSRHAARPGPTLRNGAWAAVPLLVSAGILLALVVSLGVLVTGPLASMPLGRLDATVSNAVVDARTETLTLLARAGSALSNTWTVIALAAALALLGLAATRSWRPVVFVAVAVGGEALLYLVSSRVVARPRPDVVDLTTGLPAAASWPSGHVAAAVVTYGALAVLVTTYSPHAPTGVAVSIAVAVPFVVGIARMYLAAHYLSDVLAGGAMGAAWLLVCKRCLLASGRPASESTYPHQHQR